MIIVKIVGGLGNQMFQYAYALSLKFKGYEVKLDRTLYDHCNFRQFQLDSYNISLPCATTEEISNYGVSSVVSKVARKLGLPTKVIREESLRFQDELTKPKRGRYIEGYFQNEKYFSAIRPALLKEYSSLEKRSQYLEEIKGRIEQATNSSSVHVRRGDYVDNKHISEVHGACTLEYYTRAMSTLTEKLKTPTFFIFSDDIEWVKTYIQGENIVYIDSAESRHPQEDIYLMSLCQHNIIANSSFSWWGAWLNLNEAKTVVAPRRWFLDEKQNSEAEFITPSDWLRV